MIQPMNHENNIQDDADAAESDLCSDEDGKDAVTKACLVVAEWDDS